MDDIQKTLVDLIAKGVEVFHQISDEGWASRLDQAAELLRPVALPATPPHRIRPRQLTGPAWPFIASLGDHPQYLLELDRHTIEPH